MESILDSTKKNLGLEADYAAFDLEVTTAINAAFSTLNQLGVGPEDGFFIEDNTATWTELGVPANQLNSIKTYVYLKTKAVFDPPGTSFLLEAMNEQIKQLEWRLNVFREVALPDPEEVLP